jgi:molybdopterin-synthase adenylyltransferase
MTEFPVVLLPADSADWIRERGGDWGVIELGRAEREGTIIVTGASRKDGGYVATRDKRRAHEELDLWVQSSPAGEGLWYRADPQLHEAFIQAARRDGALDAEEMRRHVSTWIHSGSGTIVLTVVPELPPGLRWAAWLVGEGQALPISLALQSPDADLLAPIAEEWPYDRLPEKPIVVIGLGSIGAAASHSLLAYGVRRQILVDPDHLLDHNFARHRLDRDQLGRRKVSAVADMLRQRDPLAEIEPLPIDILERADLLRPFLCDAAGVLVATDGVASRRVANHLACWARVPAVFACELGDGAYGELVRYRPHSSGCLWCLREALVEQGGMDPEPSLDRGYGTGNPHLPTTGVGPDLWLVAELAAKLLIATLLERSGLADQRAPGDHALIALRPRSGLGAPFDFTGNGRLQWQPATVRQPACPSCGEHSESAAA